MILHQFSAPQNRDCFGSQAMLIAEAACAQQINLDACSALAISFIRAKKTELNVDIHTREVNFRQLEWQMAYRRWG